MLFALLYTFREPEVVIADHYWPRAIFFHTYTNRPEGDDMLEDTEITFIRPSVFCKALECFLRPPGVS